MPEQLEAGVVVRFWAVRWRPWVVRQPGVTTYYVGPAWFRIHREA